MIADYTKMMTQFEIPTNPFPGLRPFEFSESLLYFGRDGQSEQLLKKLSNTRFVAVVGTSGSGKSSLVRAGLLPALFGGFMTSAGSDWHIAIMRPSNDPLGNLARAINDSGVLGAASEEEARLQATMTEATLRRGSRGLVEAVRQARIPANENLLVVADQFEELFRFAQVAESDRYQDEAAAFVKLLLEASRQREIPIYVILTMRSDFLGDCSLFWDLPEAINEGQYLIPRLTREQRREAIAGPIAVCGADITPRLVNRLLNDMGDNPDQLPILQHALMRTWDNWREENRNTDPVDLRHYEAVGEMSAALSRHADEAYNELPDERSREIAERVFKALTEKGSDNREIRRPIELRELCALVGASEAEVIAVIEVFRREGRSFLMPPAGVQLGGESLIDISHESLIRNWERLKAWVEEEARSARLYRRLAETAVLHGKGEAGLFRDPDLQLALDWRDRSKPNKTWARRYHPEFEAAMNFLDASREARDQEARDKEAQRKKELRRTRLFLAILSVAFLLSTGMAVFAWQQREEAIKQTAIADKKAKQSELDAEKAKQNEDTAVQAQKATDKALVAAAESAAKARLSEEDAKKAKDDALQQAKIAKQKEYTAVQAEGVARAAQEQARLLAENLLLSEKDTKKAKDDALEKADRLVAQQKVTQRFIYTANINDINKMYEEGHIKPGDDLLNAQMIGKEDDLRNYEWYYLWRLYHRDLPTPNELKYDVVSAAYSPDGKQIAKMGVDGTVELLDATSYKKQATLPRESPDRPETNVKFSPDGKIIATWGRDNVRLFDATSFKLLNSINTLTTQYRQIRAVAISADHKTVVINDSGGRAVSYDVTTGRRLWEFNELNAPVAAVALSPDGRTFALFFQHPFEERGRLTLYNIKPTETFNAIEKINELAVPLEVTALAFSRDGNKLATGSRKGVVNLWNSIELRDKNKTPSPIALGSADNAHELKVNTIEFSADGKQFATGSDDTTVKVWNIEQLQEETTLKGHLEPITSVSFLPDGKKLASHSENNSLKIWDISSTEPITLEMPYLATEMAFSPDSKSFVVGANQPNKEKSLMLWNDLPDKKAPTLLNHYSPVTALAYSSDGKILATDFVENEFSDSPVTLFDLSGNRKKFIGEGRGPITFSSNGNIVAVYKGKQVKLWNTVTLKEEKNIPVNAFVNAMALSTDGKTLAVSCTDKNYASEDIDSATYSVQIWDVENSSKEDYKPLTIIAGYKTGIYVMAFSGDNSLFAVGYSEGTAKIFDAKNKYQELKTLLAHWKPITALAFSSPDGRTLATGSEDKTVKLWSTATYRQLLTLKGHQNKISKIVFSPDNKILATSSLDKTVKLWRAATNAEILAYQPPLSWIKGSQFQQIPLNALSASKESSGEPLYVCRVQKQGYGNIYPGKIVNGSCNISEQDGEEHIFPQYEILVNAAGEWKNSDDSATNLREFAAGSVDGKLVNMCRAEHGGGLHIGRVDQGKCSFGLNGKEIRADKFEVFYLKP